jgi:hypothetical protein
MQVQSNDVFPDLSQKCQTQQSSTIDVIFNKPQEAVMRMSVFLYLLAVMLTTVLLFVIIRPELFWGSNMPTYVRHDIEVRQSTMLARACRQWMQGGSCSSLGKLQFLEMLPSHDLSHEAEAVWCTLSSLVRTRYPVWKRPLLPHESRDTPPRTPTSPCPFKTAQCDGNFCRIRLPRDIQDVCVGAAQFSSSIVGMSLVLVRCPSIFTYTSRSNSFMSAHFHRGKSIHGRSMYVSSMLRALDDTSWEYARLAKVVCCFIQCDDIPLT